LISYLICWVVVFISLAAGWSLFSIAKSLEQIAKSLKEIAKHVEEF
jgi:hypothetical protein